MKKQRGFTLLEIILALVIFASCAMITGKYK
jgi:prepilin-type N-terminal cleavage/methylation domain